MHQALYGLTISPRSWSVHRDGTLSELHFDVDGVRICPMTSDPNIWTVYREEDNSVVVYLALYVDDMLAVGETSHVRQTLALLGRLPLTGSRCLRVWMVRCMCTRPGISKNCCRGMRLGSLCKCPARVSHRPQMKKT